MLFGSDHFRTFIRQTFLSFFRKIPLSFWALLILSGLSQNVQGQNEATSTEDIQAFLKTHPHKDSIYTINLLQLASTIRYQDIEEAIRLIGEALSISEVLNNKELQAKSNNALGICFGMQSRYVEAIQVFEAAIQLQIEMKNDLSRATTLNNLGIVYKSMGDFNQSIVYYRQAWELHDSLHFEPGLARGSNNLGNLYRNTGAYAQAMQSFEKARQYYQKLDNPKGLASARINLAVLHIEQNQLEVARSLLDSALQYTVAEDLTSETLLIEMHLGEIDLKQKAYKEAENRLLRALQKAETLKLLESRFTILRNLVNLEVERGNLAKSREYMEIAREIAASLDQPQTWYTIETMLSEMYDKAGNPAKALTHFKNSAAWRDSINKIEAAELFKSKQVQFEVAQKNKALELQALRLDLANDKLATQRRWQWFLGILGLLGLIAGFSYYQRYRQKKRFGDQLTQQNQLITQQKTEIDRKNELLTQQYTLRKQTDDTINYFATSLFGKHNVDEILWDVAHNCIAQLGLTDCVIYLLDRKRNVLVQKAAHGPKNPIDFTIDHPIEIPLGEGIVGWVAQKGEVALIKDTSKDPRYITDLSPGLSELAVPLIQNGEVIGVLDSEHPAKDFFTQFHLDTLKTIASIAASKIAQAQADEAAQNAKRIQVEAEELKKMDQLKTRFFANFSHELRTPLNLILAPLQKKKADIPADEATLIRRNAKRLLQLVNQTLDLNKINAGLMQLHLEPVELFGFLSELADGFTILAESKSITYQVDIPERDYVAACDTDKLEKIIYNLLANAFKFTAPGGKVSIHVALDSQAGVRIVVSDSGRGIPEHQLDKVFHRYYQVEGAAAAHYEGTGIGLSLTKELVELMGGTILVDSQEGKGSVFALQLPLQFLPDAQVLGAKPAINSPDAADALLTTSLDGKVETTHPDAPIVLLVEDNEELNRYTQRELASSFNVITASNGQIGLELATQKIPDLIISDIMMPHMDGIEMARTLQKNLSTAHIPLIFLTAKGDEKTKVEGFEGGAEQFLLKPFDMSELLARIKSILEKRAILKEKYGRTAQLPTAQIQSTDPNSLFIKQLVETVEENLDNEHFTVSDLQNAVAMSRMQLHRKLKALLGQSASEFIRGIRLQRAAELLAQPGFRVQEVAYNVGFMNLSYFAKCFKERFGVNPSEYQGKH